MLTCRDVRNGAATRNSEHRHVVQDIDLICVGRDLRHAGSNCPFAESVAMTAGAGNQLHPGQGT